MRLSLVPLLALFASLAAAQGPNAFDAQDLTGFAAGKTSTLKWSNLQGGTVTIMLREGPSGTLGQGTTIASKIQNTGSFAWEVPSSITAGSDYALEIIDDDDPNLMNFSGEFAISSPNSASASASTASATSGSSSASASAATTTGSKSSSAAATTTGASTAKSSTSPSASASSASSSPANNPAPIVKVGGSLLAVAFGFAVAL